MWYSDSLQIWGGGGAVALTLGVEGDAVGNMQVVCPMDNHSPQIGIRERAIRDVGWYI